jgi:hypothetical protein
MRQGPYQIEYSSPPDRAERPVRSDRQSGLGVACVVLSVPPAAAAFSLFVLILLLRLNGDTVPSGLEYLGMWAAFLFYGWFLFAPLVFISVGLGIGGVAQSGRARHLALTGLCLNALAVVAWATTIVVAS